MKILPLELIQPGVIGEQRMLVQRITKSAFTKFILPVLMTTLLMACGGGGGSDGGGSGSGSGSSSSIDAPIDAPIVPLGAVTLAWDAPLDRADGSPLQPGEIEGYRIYYGTAEGNYPHRIDVNDGTVVQITLTDLAPGTYYFVMTTLDTSGHESKYTSVVIRTV